MNKIQAHITDFDFIYYNIIGKSPENSQACTQEAAFLQSIVGDGLRRFHYADSMTSIPG